MMTTNFQPPRRPRRGDVRAYPEGEARMAAARAHRAAVELYEEDLARWEQSVPQNVPLIFEEAHIIKAITRAIGGGWRTTGFSTADHAPSWHVTYSSRLKALREEAGGVRIERMPFEVEPLPPGFRAPVGALPSIPAQASGEGIAHEPQTAL